MTEYVSGEKHKAEQQARPAKRPGGQSRWLWMGVTTSIVAAFFIGIGVASQGKSPTASNDMKNSGMMTSSANGAPGGPGSNMGGPNGQMGTPQHSPSKPDVVGKITNISATSITIAPANGDPVTLTITDKTLGMDTSRGNMRPLDASTLKVGDLVGVSKGMEDPTIVDVVHTNYQES